MPTARRQLSPTALVAASDARLVALTRLGDERAFAAIVGRYRGPLARQCRRFLPAAAAEDALQQTFINAHASLTNDAATLPLALKPWLYRIARNASLNIARDPQSALGPVPDDLLGRDDEPEDVFARREWFDSFVEAIGALPDSQRRVIVRHAFDGDSHEAIAADLGMSAGAIRQLAYRARGTLRAAA
jgi:RNA polymerase sigma factor (sigma-70 family)